MANLFKCMPIALYLSQLPMLLKPTILRQDRNANEASQSKPADDMPT